MLCFRSAYERLMSIHPVLGILASWDLTRVKRYLEATEGFAMEHLDAMEREYKRFHALVVLNQGDRPVPITLHVDPMWHAHILFTADYRCFCEAVHGLYLNHNPTVTDLEREHLRPAYIANTLADYDMYFGLPPVEFWGATEEAICLSDRVPVVCVQDRMPVVCVQDRIAVDEHSLLSCRR